ncbi:hypothetical protein L2E82_15479 [Cichorium intybus]|uniref:Uncharacterized protein n=1 Tax=Cichorium intybus TaxID=13427 RepID=A0ACB9F436_CICIN|nr:hypothetical protein L2E82_15479 [Cichorium intybus]
MSSGSRQIGHRRKRVVGCGRGGTVVVRLWIGFDPDRDGTVRDGLRKMVRNMNQHHGDGDIQIWKPRIGVMELILGFIH